MSFFLPAKQNEYVGYKNLRESNNCKDFRDYLEYLWKIWQPHSDRHFQRECQKSDETLNQRFWEMFLGCHFINMGYDISSKNHGPDICINSNPKIWIEAIAPLRGEPGSPNSVPETIYEEIKIDEETGEVSPIHGRGGLVSELENPIRLRYLSAIKNKYCSKDSSGKRRGILPYLINDIISEDEPVIIAINSANIDDVVGDIPVILKSCFGIGDPQIHFSVNKKTGEIKKTGSSYTRRETAVKITNNGEKNINSHIFQWRSYPYISAIIFSFAKLTTALYGSQVILIHNPFAVNPMQIGALKVDREYWLEDIKYNEDKSIIIEAQLKQN